MLKLAADNSKMKIIRIFSVSERLLLGNDDGETQEAVL